MSKVIAKDFRPVKTITLPISKVEIEFYSSILVSDLTAVTKVEQSFVNNIQTVLKAIKSWNLYLNETDEKPAELNIENFNKIPAPDFTFLIEEMEKFATEQKKS